MRPSPDRHLRAEGGFVLLAVLVITGAIGAIALALSLVTRDDYSESRLGRDLALARLHADNALVRAIAALGDPSDALHGTLLQPASSFPHVRDGVSVNLTVEHESGKIDLNRADPVFILNALLHLSPQSAGGMHGRVIDMRGRGEFISDIRSILSVGQQFEPIARQIGRVFTVLTGARGITPDRSSPEILAAIPGILPDELKLLLQGRRIAGVNLSPIMVKYRSHFSPGRAIYTIRSVVVHKGLPRLRRQAIVALNNLPVRYRTDLDVLAWRDE